MSQNRIYDDTKSAIFHDPRKMHFYYLHYMNFNTRNFVFLMVICLGMSSCAILGGNRNMDKQSKAIIEKAIAYAGGQEKFDSLGNMHYLKEVIFYGEDGNQQSKNFELHSYDMTEASGKIEWIINSVRTKISYTKDQLKYAKNGMYDASKKQDGINKLKASHYVLFMPWRLIDGNADIRYVGEKQLPNEEILVDVLEVNYENENPDRDIWWYYFNKKTGAWEGNMVKHKDHYSYVRNLSMRDFKGIKLHGKRKSYRVDADGNILYLRADYNYQNYR